MMTPNTKQVVTQHTPARHVVILRACSTHETAKARPGADCGSDHELLITKFRLKFKTVGKTTTPLRYDLNQIHYDFTVEMIRFKGLELVGRVPEELCIEVRKLYRRW